MARSLDGMYIKKQEKNENILGPSFEMPQKELDMNSKEIRDLIDSINTDLDDEPDKQETNKSTTGSLDSLLEEWEEHFKTFEKETELFETPTNNQYQNATVKKEQEALKQELDSIETKVEQKKEQLEQIKNAKEEQSNESQLNQINIQEQKNKEFREKYQELFNKLENSSMYRIIRISQETSSFAEDFLLELRDLKNNKNINIVEKYNLLEEKYNQSKDLAVSLIKTIDKNIKAYNEPNFENYDKKNPNTSENFAESFFKLGKRSKAVCNALKEMFKNEKVRHIIDNNELYEIYDSYLKIVDLVQNNKITREKLEEIEKRCQGITNKVWEKEITKVQNYKQGEPFKFLVYNVAYGELDGNDFHRQGRLSTSLISEKDMGLLGGKKHGFIMPFENQIITSGINDLHSYEDDNYGNYMRNQDNTSLLLPEMLEQGNLKKNIELNGRPLYYDKGIRHNEVLLNTNNNIKPSAVFCITFGEKELSNDYLYAKKMAELYNLPLVDIDITKYRTKNNIGFIDTDNEIMTKKEQLDFTERFLKNLYKKEWEQSPRNTDIKIDMEKALYSDVINDIFMHYKESGMPIDKKELFKEYETRKQKDRTKGEITANIIGESQAIYLSINKLNEQMKVENDQTKAEILMSKINELLSREEELKHQLNTTKKLELHNENRLNTTTFYTKVLENYTQYTSETLVIDNKKIPIITGIKTKEELEHDKEKIFATIEGFKKGDQKRKEHAKDYVEAKLKEYKAESLNANMAYNQKAQFEKHKDIINISPETLYEKAENKIKKQQMKSKSQEEIEIEYNKLLKEKDDIEFLINETKKEMLVHNTAKNYASYQEKKIDEELSLSQINSKIETTHYFREKYADTFDKLIDKADDYHSKNILYKLLHKKEYNAIHNQLLDAYSNLQEQEMQLKELKQQETESQNKQKEIEAEFLEKYVPSGMSLSEYKTIISKHKIEDLVSQSQSLEARLKEVNTKIKELNKQVNIGYEINIAQPKKNISI